MAAVDAVGQSIEATVLLEAGEFRELACANAAAERPATVLTSTSNLLYI